MYRQAHLIVLVFWFQSAVLKAYSIGSPTGSLFSSADKPVQMMVFLDWAIRGSSGLFAIACFMSAGNYAREGHYGRCMGACIGGFIGALAVYFIDIVQK